MSLCLGVARRLIWGANAWKKASREPSTKDDIQTVRLCAFTPPGSPLERHSVVGFSSQREFPGRGLRL